MIWISCYKLGRFHYYEVLPPPLIKSLADEAYRNSDIIAARNLVRNLLLAIDPEALGIENGRKLSPIGLFV